MKKLTENELAFYRKHPELIRAVGDKAMIYRVVLLVELTVDLVFELGVALWGGVATTVLLQDYVKRQYNEGRRYQQEIISQLANVQSGAESS
jgi:hypothetical protein